MALPFFNWSRTAASNATADSTVNWAEGQAPSSVNDSGRAMMASTAAYRDDVAGAITTGGSATAYTVTSYQVFDTLAHLNGQTIAFVPHATNTNAVGVDITLNVDGLGAKSVRLQKSVALPNGSLVLGTPYIVTYNSSDAVFYLRNMTNPYNIPLGGGLPFFGIVAPNSSFVFPFGQAISRITYATLFALIAVQYGVGNGSTTFNLPDMRGRVPAGKDDMGGSAASRLTTTYLGTDPTTLGAFGGGQSSTLVAGNLPAYTPAGSVTVTSVGVTYPVRAFSAGGVSDPTKLFLSMTGGVDSGTLSGSASGTASFSGTAQGGVSTPFTNVQPTFICNFIIRII